MKTETTLKKAIAARGTSASPALNMRIMAAVRLAEARRRRRRLWMNVILAVLGVIAVAGALAVYCGEIFAAAFGALRFDVKPASGISSDMLSLLVPPVVLLLQAELLIQRHFYRRDVAKIESRQ